MQKLSVLPLLLSTAIAASPGPSDRPVSLYGGVEVGGGASGPMGGIGGALAWHASPKLGLLVGVREVVASSPDRTIGTLTFAARVPLLRWLSGHLGFVHAHETPLALSKSRPVGTALGTLPEMTHRSGLGAGLRGEWRAARWERWGGFVAGRVDLWPDAHPSPVHAGLELGIAVDVGKRRELPAEGR
jgi:hypothetical protein